LIPEAIAGVLIILIILWEAFETVVLPRRVARKFRVTVLFYRATWFLCKTVSQRVKNKRTYETLLSFYGPLSLLLLFIFWAALLILGFGLLFFDAGGRDTNPYWFRTACYLSGTTFFTLGLGDVTPHSPIERFLAVIESGLGFGFLALVLSYLPVIYQAFSRREVPIVLLDARGGSPPTAAEILRRHSGHQGIAALQTLLLDWERYSAEILESHVSYPVLCYFRSQHNNESWLSALNAILDTSALLISKSETICSRQARLTFAMCRHTIVDLAQVFGAVPRAPLKDRLPLVEEQRLHEVMTKSEYPVNDSDDANEKLTKLRGMYEPYMRALSEYLVMEIPPFILAQEITDNWKTSAWGRITGFASETSKTAQSEAVLDDHAV
jgi:hypothetical protein